MIVKLTGLSHGNLKKLDDICPGNAVDVTREPKWDKPEGKAYKATCKGVEIGYIPLIPTLRGYYQEASNDEQRDRLAQWGRATSAVRLWLESRENYMLESKWTVRVKTLLYDHFGVHKPEDNGKVAAVAVDFEDVPKD